MSVIEEGLVVSGDIFGEDQLTVKGVVKGAIFLQKSDVHIAASGYVEGEIVANHITVAGEIRGNLTALAGLQLTATAKVVGNIRTAKIALADGAFFSGRLETGEPGPYELDIQDFTALSEEDYAKLRRWRVRNHLE